MSISNSYNLGAVQGVDRDSLVASFASQHNPDGQVSIAGLPENVTFAADGPAADPFTM